jgi:hypothetical protein
MDMGDHVVVINARKAVFTGSKNDQKLYRRHTLYPGGLRETTVKEMFEKKPEKVIELAVKGMLPKTKLGKAMVKKLKVYADGDHRHFAQKARGNRNLIGISDSGICDCNSSNPKSKIQNPKSTYGRHSVLRHRPQKDFDSTRLLASGLRRDHCQSPHFRCLLP